MPRAPVNDTESEHMNHLVYLYSRLFHWERSPIKLVYFFLKCMYQVRKVSGHVFVCSGYRFCLFLQFSYWILDLFEQCGIFSYSENKLFYSFISCYIYMCYGVQFWWKSRSGGWNPINQSNPATMFATVPNQDLDFQPHIYIVVFFIFNDFRREMIVRFVDIGGIVDHHCLNFLYR